METTALIDVSTLLSISLEKRDSSNSEALTLILEPLEKELLSSAKTAAECQLLMSHQCNTLADILENIQSRNSAAEHISQDIKAINNRAVIAATNSLEKLDRIYSSTLVKLIDDGDGLRNKLQEKFRQTLKKQREDFKKAYECEALLENGIEARYKLLRDSITSVMKNSFERTEHRFDELAALDKQNFEWAMQELRTTKLKWVDKSEAKRKTAHATVGRKLQDVMDATIANSTKLAAQSLRNRTRLRRFNQLCYEYRIGQCGMLEGWSEQTVEKSEILYEMMLGDLYKEINDTLALDSALRHYERELEAYQQCPCAEPVSNSNVDSDDFEEEEDLNCLNDLLLKYVGIDFSGLSESATSISNVRQLRIKVRHDVIADSGSRDMTTPPADARPSNDASEIISNSGEELDYFRAGVVDERIRNVDGLRMGNQIKSLCKFLKLDLAATESILLDVLFGDSFQSGEDD